MDFFERVSGYKTARIAIGGATIDYLIKAYEPLTIDPRNIKGIIFIHGESDSTGKTDPSYYVERVEVYRKMISADIGIDLPMYISTVGYKQTKPEFDYSFDLIRNAIIDNSKYNPKWHIAFNYAQYYRDWGMIKEDGIHFGRAGCELMMRSIADYIK